VGAVEVSGVARMDAKTESCPAIGLKENKLQISDIFYLQNTKFFSLSIQVFCTVP